jgi:glutamate formiminotransferase/formiminotetrahydrofolate cyclodeaminase
VIIMAKLVECVPNFSEGRDMAKIDAITAEIASTEGTTLLDVDPGKDTNRTVVTFVGTPEAAIEAAFRAIARAAEVIDMSRHQGAHARMGANCRQQYHKQHSYQLHYILLTEQSFS